MEDLTNDDLKQLLIFYKGKSSDLELEFLRLQINNKKQIEKIVEEKVNKIILEKTKENDKSLFEIDLLKRKINTANEKYCELDGKYNKLNAKYLKLIDNKKK